jgi:hypothetical protein
MRLGQSAALGFALGIVFILLLAYATASVAALQSPDDYSPVSTAWNGLSSFVSLEKAEVLQNLSSLPPRGAGYTLFVIGPSTPFSGSESGLVKSFVSTGGRLVVCDDFGSANTLLSGIGLSSRFSGGLLTDPLFNFRNSWLLTVPRVGIQGVGSIAMNYATTLSSSSSLDSGGSVLAFSSPFSYIEPSQPNAPVSSAPLGPFPVAARVPLGAGEVYLISDSSVFINSMLGLQGNRQLALYLGSGTVLLDGSHWSVGPATALRNFELGVYSALSAPELKYTLLLVGAGLVIASRTGGGGGGEEAREDEGELRRVTEEHPEWDERLLRELKEDMER